MYLWADVFSWLDLWLLQSVVTGEKWSQRPDQRRPLFTLISVSEKSGLIRRWCPFSVCWVCAKPLLSTCDPHPDLQYLADVRQQIPITAQRRDDLYTVTTVKEGSSWSLQPREKEGLKETDTNCATESPWSTRLNCFNCGKRRCSLSGRWFTDANIVWARRHRSPPEDGTVICSV